MLLRALRQPSQGRPSLLARSVALLIVIGLVAMVSPALFEAARWLLVTMNDVLL